jgi:hypothetical protein
MVINIVLLLLLFAVYKFALVRGRKMGYNDCLEANRSAFDTEAERLEKQRKLIHKAYVVGKMQGSKLESDRRRDD